MEIVRAPREAPDEDGSGTAGVSRVEPPPDGHLPASEIERFPSGNGRRSRASGLPLIAAAGHGGAVGTRPTVPTRVAPEKSVEVRQPRRRPHPPAGTFDTGDKIFNALTTVFALLILVILAGMLFILVVQSRDSLQAFGLSFLYTRTWDPIHNVFGAAPAILGTVYTSFLALLIAAPVGIMVAVFLTEISPRRIRFPLGFVVELLAAVPSIVFGLWALFVLVPLVRQYIQPPILDHFGNVPLFQGYPLGLGVFTASLILAIMILPTITAISRDVILAVPNSQRDAILALGATRWEMIRRVVIPAARSGMIGAIILALGRAVGETMAVQMVIGNTQDFNISVFNAGTTMPATIVNQFTEATGATYQAALIEIALILMLVTILLNAVARLLVWRVTTRVGVR